MRFDNLGNEKLVRLVGIVMGAKSNCMIEIEFFARAIIFLKEIWTLLGKAENVSKYSLLLREVLKSSHPFYSIGFNEEELQVLELYLGDITEVMDIEEEDNPFAKLNPHPFRFNS